MQVGEPVEVYSAYENIWSDGFVIAEVGNGGYTVRRLSDGSLLPRVTSETDLRSVVRH